MAKMKQTKRMMAMALAAAVTMSAVPTVAFAEEVPVGQSADGNTTITTEKDDNDNVVKVTVTEKVDKTETDNIDANGGKKIQTVTETDGTETTEKTGDAITATDGTAGENGAITTTTEVTVTTTSTLYDKNNKVKDQVTTVESATTVDSVTTEVIEDSGTDNQVDVTTEVKLGETDEKTVTDTEIIVTETTEVSSYPEDYEGEKKSEVYIAPDGTETTIVETTTVVEREVTLIVTDTTPEVSVDEEETEMPADTEGEETPEELPEVTEVELNVENQYSEQKDDNTSEPHPNNTDDQADNDVYTTDLKVTVSVNDRTGETYVNVYAGDTPVASKKVAKDSDDVTFENLTLQENYKVDIKLENIGWLKDGEGVIIPTSKDEKETFASYELQFNVDENDKKTVRTSKRTYKKISGSDKSFTKLFKGGEEKGAIPFLQHDIVVVIDGKAYQFTHRGNSGWDNVSVLRELGISDAGKEATVYDLKTNKVYTVKLVNHEQNEQASLEGTDGYEIASWDEITAGNPNPEGPDGNPPYELPDAPPTVPTVPMVPLVPATPITPTVPMVPLVPATPITPTVPMVPLVPATPITPTVPMVPLVPATPITPPGGGDVTPPSSGGGNGSSNKKHNINIEDEKVPMTNLELVDEPMIEEVVIGEEDVPMADMEIPEEEVPLVAAEEEIIAGTGDSNHMAAGFGGMFAALAGMFMLRRKKEQ